MAQRYTDPTALERMADNLCPECGMPGSSHSTSSLFWERYGCSLRPDGVADRIAQYEEDQREECRARLPVTGLNSTTARGYHRCTLALDHQGSHQDGLTTWSS